MLKKLIFWAENAHVWSLAKGDVFVGGGNWSKFLLRVLHVCAGVRIGEIQFSFWKKKLIFIQNSRRAEGENLACQQLSQGSRSLPEFGGKPQLGVNGTVNELMLAAGGWGEPGSAGHAHMELCPAHGLQLPAQLHRAPALGAMCLGRCESPLPAVPCSLGCGNELGNVAPLWGRECCSKEHGCSQCGSVIF